MHCTSPPTDTSLTLTNLTQIMEDVEMGRYVRIYLDIPPSVYNDISKQHSDESQKKKALCEWYLNNHPSPSWKHIAQYLYLHQKHDVLDVLDVLRGRYLKGGSACCYICYHMTCSIVLHVQSLNHTSL